MVHQPTTGGYLGTTFGEQFEALAVDPKRLDMAMSYFDESVSAHPETYPRVEGTPFHRALLYVYEDAPPLRIFFVYNTVQVRLVCIEFAQQE
jgi:hypothetical protein